MNKRLFLMLCASVTILCSCSLAQPEETVTTDITDQLVGVFVTTEPLDLIDTDAWLAENAAAIVNGEDLSSPYEDENIPRVYAELTDKSITDSKGDTRTVKCYQFRDLDGLFFASFRIQDEKDPNESYRSIDSSDYFFDLHSATTAKDDGFSLELTGTLYLGSNAEGTVFYFHPIYQAEDGDVYLVPGDGMQAQTGVSAFTLSATSTTNTNGEVHNYQASIEVNMCSVEIAQKIVLIEMSADNVMLGQTEFLPGHMPETFTTTSSTAYLIAEEHRESGVVRTIYQSEDKFIPVFRTQDGTICQQERITIQWQNDQ